MESLLALNQASAKFMDWHLRVVHPRIVQYQFTTRKQEVVNAAKFQAYLVGNKPTEYVLASVPFCFKDAGRAARALQKYGELTAWKLASVALEPNSKSQWNGCPNKEVVLLETPTKIHPLMHGSEEEKLLSRHIEPPMRLADILEVMQTQSVDCAVVLEEVQRLRTEVARGKQVSVCTIVVTDDSNARANITCWEEQAEAVQGLAGQAGTVFGMIAVYDNQEVKLSIRGGAVLDFTSNTRHEQLQENCKGRTEATQIRCVTQSWTARAPSCDGNAVLACASFLRTASKEEHYAMQEPFQLMGVYASGNLIDIYTKDKQRFFIHGVLRDWSGSVPVSFLDSCVLTLLQCDSKEEVEIKLAANELSMTSEPLNVRVFKNGKDYHVAQIAKSSGFVEPNKSAQQLAELATLCGPSADGMVTCAASELVSSAVLNLGVRVDGGVIVAPYRAVLFVQGTQKSQLITKGTTAASRVIFSEKVKCLLSKEACSVNLRAYAHEDMLLEYKLDKGVAIVFVTALQKVQGECTCIVDRMELISTQDEVQKVQKYMEAMHHMSCSPRQAQDSKRACEFITPESMKRARTIQAYPSDA